MSDDFQTAFPEDQPEQEVPDGMVCAYGCGQPAKHGNLRPGFGQPGDLPRCALYKSECPVIKGAALRSARKSGRLNRRW